MRGREIPFPSWGLSLSTEANETEHHEEHGHGDRETCDNENELDYIGKHLDFRIGILIDQIRCRALDTACQTSNYGGEALKQKAKQFRHV